MRKTLIIVNTIYRTSILNLLGDKSTYDTTQLLLIIDNCGRSLYDGVTIVLPQTPVELSPSTCVPLILR